jgi:hypothetical protein
MKSICRIEGELELINRFDDTAFGFECPLTDLQVSGQHRMSLTLLLAFPLQRLVKTETACKPCGRTFEQ